MSAVLIDGKSLADGLRVRVRGEVERLAAAGVTPGLAVVLVGENPASQVYVKNKSRETLLRRALGPDECLERVGA